MTWLLPLLLVAVAAVAVRHVDRENVRLEAENLRLRNENAALRAAARKPDKGE